MAEMARKLNLALGESERMKVENEDLKRELSERAREHPVTADMALNMPTLEGTI